MRGEVFILNNRVDWFDSQLSLFDEIVEKSRDIQFKGYITVNNVHTMMEGYRHINFKDIINSSYLSIPDGKPLEIVGKLKGQKNICRLFGPTVMENCIDWGRKDGLTHFFFGSSPENLIKLEKAILSKYPGANIVGMLAPPYFAMNDWPNDQYLQEINKVKPDLIWVGLGAPKQEQWMFRNIGKLEKGIMIGIGAGFDYLAGNTRHAPQWMKDASLEWLYRLHQEPKRLWKRYMLTIPPFMLLAMLDIVGHEFRKK